MNTKSENRSDRLARLYSQQSEDDLKLAKQALKQGVFLKSSLLSGQAANNALSSLLIFKKKFQTPSYNLNELLKFCSALDNQFENIREDCLLLDEIHEFTFFQESESVKNYVPQKRAEKYFNAAEKIIKQSSQIIKKNKWF